MRGEIIYFLGSPGIRLRDNVGASGRLEPSNHLKGASMSRIDDPSKQQGSATGQMREKASEVGQNLREMGHQAKQAAQEQVENLRETASEYYRQGRDKAAEYYEQGREKAQEWEQSLESYVREQ